MEKCRRCNKPLRYVLKTQRNDGSYTNYTCDNCNTDYYIDNPFHDGDIDYCEDE